MTERVKVYQMNLDGEIDARKVAEINRVVGQLIKGEMSEPEFAEVDVARRALRILEERSLLQELITRTMVTTKVGGVEVLIGGEGNWEELRECAVVLARYGVPGIVTGTLGVLGPIRMSYGRTISTVRFVAGVLSDMMGDVLVE